MQHRILKIFLLVTLCFITSVSFANVPKKSEVIKTENNIELWYEAFGDKSNPAILLIMGAGSQALLWPETMCEQLAQHGYYVIRYDGRDVGLSSKIDYDKIPYTVLDLKDDAVHLLNTLNIEQAHVVGMSMGGYITQYLALEHPSRVKSITLMATTADHSIAMDAFQGKASKDKTLPPPSVEYIQTLNDLQAANQSDTPKDEAQELMDLFKGINGNLPFDTKYWSALCQEMAQRANGSKSHFNHLPAQMAITEDRTEKLQKLNVPALVIHGAQDPIFPKAHGRHLADALKADYVEVYDMGHAIAPTLSDFYATLIARHITQMQY